MLSYYINTDNKKISYIKEKNKIYMNQYNDSSEVEHIIDNTIESRIEDTAIRFAEYLGWKPFNEDNSQTQASENTDNRQK